MLLISASSIESKACSAAVVAISEATLHVHLSGINDEQQSPAKPGLSNREPLRAAKRGR
jgi:hypothetical protein